MSLVYITFHEENIRDIEKPTSAEKHHRFEKYVSIHKKSARNPPPNLVEKQGKKVISASNRYLHKTFGFAETPLENPSEYLKKDGGIKWERLKEHVCPPSRSLPPIPKIKDMEKNEAPRNKNFIEKNIKRIKTAVPRKVPEKYVDTVIGEKHNLDGTGLVPRHVLSKKFGKSPVYLKNIKKILEESNCNQSNEEQDLNHGITELSSSERNKILLGLRANHSELEKAYQLLPIFTDTTSKKQRKAQLERKLKRLEQDILLIESNPHILICED